MKDEWYADKRDLIKWGSLLLLADWHGVGHILQVAYYRASEWPPLEIDGKPYPIPGSVGHFRDVKRSRRLSPRVQIEVLAAPIAPLRSSYFVGVLAAVKRMATPRLVFLDPDTGRARRHGGPAQMHAPCLEDQLTPNGARPGRRCPR